MADLSTGRKRLTSDPLTIKWRIQKLDELRGRGPLKVAERWNILTTYFALHQETRDKSCFTQARRITSILCGRSARKVRSIVTSWMKASQIPEHNDALLKNSVFEVLLSESTAIQHCKTPNLSEDLVQVLYFVQNKRLNRKSVTST